jgi:hypothetical protein
MLLAFMLVSGVSQGTRGLWPVYLGSSIQAVGQRATFLFIILCLFVGLLALLPIRDRIAQRRHAAVA